MKNKFNAGGRYLIVGLMFLLIIIMGGQVHADGGPRYYISPLPTANQLNKDNAYFYLKVGEKNQQKIQVRVYNSSNKELTLQERIINAYTNNNGYIGYEPSLKPITYDKTLRYKLTDFVKLESPEKFTIKPNSSVVVTAKIDSTLASDFNGEILGSWYFVQHGGNTRKIKSNMSINNNYGYVTSIGLQKGDVVLPDMKLTKARAMVLNGNPGAGITIQNPKAGIMKNLNLKTKVIRLKDNKNVLLRNANNLELAPNSNFEYFLNATDKPLIPGKYRAVVDAQSGMQNWHLTREFTVTQGEVNEIKKQTVSYDKIPWTWIIISAILLLAVIILLFVLWKKRKQKQTDQDPDITEE